MATEINISTFLEHTNVKSYYAADVCGNAFILKDERSIFMTLARNRWGLIPGCSVQYLLQERVNNKQSKDEIQCV